MSEEIEPRGERRSTDDPRYGRRMDAMFTAAYIAVASLVYIVVFVPGVGEYAQGVITLVLGAFLNELKNMYNYETGNTRSSKESDAAIKDIAKSQIAANPAAVLNAIAPKEVKDMNVHAEGAVNIEREKK